MLIIKRPAYILIFSWNLHYRVSQLLVFLQQRSKTIFLRIVETEKSRYFTGKSSALFQQDSQF